MSTIVEKTGKTIEEAIAAALEELQCVKDEAEVEILTSPTKGFFGMGSKDAKVKVWRKEAGADTLKYTGGGAVSAGDTIAGSAVPERVSADTADKTMAFILDVTGRMGIEASVEKIEDEEALYYEINGPRMGAIIGRRGETLDALQYLSNIVAGRDKEIPRKRIIVDAEDYRKRREETLVRLATRLAAKAKKSGRRVVLEPMNPQERRVIHTALEEDPGVKSLSEGEEPYRRLVIYPVGADGKIESGGRSSRGAGRYNSGSQGDRSQGGSWHNDREGSNTRTSWEQDFSASEDDDEE